MKRGINTLFIIMIIITLATGCSKDEKLNTNLPKDEGINTGIPEDDMFFSNIELTNMIEEYSMFEYNYPTYYFMHKEHLYYYDYKTNELFVLNLDGTDKRLITKSDELHNASFFLVYKDEAYFYNSEKTYKKDEKKYNKKINLKTGQITNLNNDYAFLPETFNNGTITATGCRTKITTCSIEYVKYDLDTNKVELENKGEKSNGFYLMFDEKTGETFEIKTDKDTVNKSITYTIRHNNTEIGKFTLKDVYVSEKGNMNNYIIYINKYFVIIEDNEKIYKYNFKTKELTTNKGIGSKYTTTIPSNNKDTVFIYDAATCFIYELDLINGTVKKLFKVEGNEARIENYSAGTDMKDTYIYDTYSKIYIFVNSNNLKYSSVTNVPGRIAIYDRTTGETEIKENITRAFIDYENKELYTYTQERNDKYRVNKYYANRYSLKK